MLISTFRFLSLPSSFRLSSQNLKYTRVLCFALFLFPFISWFISYCLMIRSIGLFEIIFHHFTFAENLHNVGDSVSVSLQQPTGFPSQTVLTRTPLWSCYLDLSKLVQVFPYVVSWLPKHLKLDSFSLLFLGNIVVC